MKIKVRNKLGEVEVREIVWQMEDHYNIVVGTFNEALNHVETFFVHKDDYAETIVTENDTMYYFSAYNILANTKIDQSFSSFAEAYSALVKYKRNRNCPDKETYHILRVTKGVPSILTF